MIEELQSRIPDMPSEEECRWALDTIDRVIDMSKLHADLNEEDGRDMVYQASKVQYLLKSNILDLRKMICRRVNRKKSSKEAASV